VPALRTNIQAGLTGEKVANPLALLSIAFGIGAALVGRSTSPCGGIHDGGQAAALVTRSEDWSSWRLRAPNDELV
jgi:hypothetical protein